MADLQLSDPNEPGIVRRRRGRGFSYLHPDGRRQYLCHDLWRERGTTIAPALTELGADVDFGQLATYGGVERAVVDLLTRS